MDILTDKEAAWIAARNLTESAVNHLLIKGFSPEKIALMLIQTLSNSLKEKK